MARWVGAQGQVNSATRAKTCPHYDVSQRKTTMQNEKKNFHLNYKTCWIRRGFEQLHSSISWRVIVLQSSVKTVAPAGLKGKTPSTYGYCLRESTRYPKC